MTIPLATPIATVLVLASAAKFVAMNPEVVDGAVSGAISIFQLNAEPAPSTEVASSTDEQIVKAIRDGEQILGQAPSARIIDLTDEARSPEHGASKVEEILALHRQSAEAEEFIYSFDLTDAASSEDHGASLIQQMAVLQAKRGRTASRQKT